MLEAELKGFNSSNSLSNWGWGISAVPEIRKLGLLLSGVVQFSKKILQVSFAVIIIILISSEGAPKVISTKRKDMLPRWALFFENLSRWVVFWQHRSQAKTSYLLFWVSITYMGWSSIILIAKDDKNDHGDDDTNNNT